LHLEPRSERRPTALRILGHLLERELAALRPGEQLVYLRLVWLAGLRTGSVRCSLERLVAVNYPGLKSGACGGLESACPRGY